MANCECGAPRRIFSSHCSDCLAKGQAAFASTIAARESSTPVAAAPASGSNSGAVAQSIGQWLMILSLLCGFVLVAAFAQVKVPSAYGYGTNLEWSPFLLSIYIGGALNGMFFGYLLSTVGKVLTRLEKQQA